jgi:F-type H+-transporting ATPase subunit gamma
MPSLKEIRVRLNSVRSTKQITSAMKMVSAAKLRKAQDTIIQMRPFANKLQEIYQTAGNSVQEQEKNIFFEPNNSEHVLLIVISSNRGLCGAFNSNIVKRTLAHIAEHYETERKENMLDILCIGKKGGDSLKSKKLPVVESNNTVFDALTFENSKIIADKLIHNFLTKKYGIIELIYNQFRNAAMQDVLVERFLPLISGKSTDNPYTDPVNYILEPSGQSLIEKLIPLALRIHVHKALLDSWASEQGARMTAMHKATDNATDFIRELELTYNKARQASITKELSEIVSGANALKG